MILIAVHKNWIKIPREILWSRQVATDAMKTMSGKLMAQQILNFKNFISVWKSVAKFSIFAKLLIMSLLPTSHVLDENEMNFFFKNPCLRPASFKCRSFKTMPFSRNVKNGNNVKINSTAHSFRSCFSSISKKKPKINMQL